MPRRFFASSTTLPRLRCARHHDRVLQTTEFERPFCRRCVHATLTVPAGANSERLLRILEKTEKACLVSASLSTPIRLEPQLQERRTWHPAVPHQQGITCASPVRTDCRHGTCCLSGGASVRGSDLTRDES